MITKLGPGTLADRTVAVEVLGWKYDDRWKQIVPPGQDAGPDEMYEDAGNGYLRTAKGVMVKGITYGGDLSVIHVPKYTTEDSAALTVLKSFYHADILMSVGLWVVTLYDVGKFHPVDRGEKVGESGEQADLCWAICLAALRAKGVENV